ncbi:MAG: response regulator [Nitrospirales bacterium]|nr:response regulator [Nitrospirales bacterium]
MMTSPISKKVLLVDDDRNAREALRMVLESQGFDCQEVTNGEEALQWLSKDHADLIVSDNQMPVLGGLDFIDQLQRQQNFPTPPVILLSGNLDDPDKARARQAGVFAILDKPCNFSEFVSMVQLALDR